MCPKCVRACVRIEMGTFGQKERRIQPREFPCFVLLAPFLVYPVVVCCYLKNEDNIPDVNVIVAFSPRLFWIAPPPVFPPFALFESSIHEVHFHSRSQDTGSESLNVRESLDVRKRERDPVSPHFAFFGSIKRPRTMGKGDKKYFREGRKKEKTARARY